MHFFFGGSIRTSMQNLGYLAQKNGRVIAVGTKEDIKLDGRGWIYTINFLVQLSLAWLELAKNNRWIWKNMLLNKHNPYCGFVKVMTFALIIKKSRWEIGEFLGKWIAENVQLNNDKYSYFGFLNLWGMGEFIGRWISKNIK